MVAKPKTYTWRRAPTHSRLMVTHASFGPDLNEGGSWEILISLGVPKRGFKTKPATKSFDLIDTLEWKPAIRAYYEGTGGPTEWGPLDRSKPNQKLYDDAVKILEDLAVRTKHIREFDLRTSVEIMIEDMAIDHHTEREIRKHLARGHLVGIKGDGHFCAWECRRNESFEQARIALITDPAFHVNIVEWAHQTLLADGGPKPHHLPKKVPKAERWHPPEDSPCWICRDMVDRKHGYQGLTCQKIVCDAIDQESMHAAKGKIEEYTPDKYLLQVSLSGFNTQGPIGRLVRLACQLRFATWSDDEQKEKARIFYLKVHEAFSQLGQLSKEYAGDGERFFKVPSLEEIREALNYFPELVRLHQEREADAA